MYFAPEHYLNRDAAAGKVMVHARLLLKLSRRFATIAPLGLRNAARVANYKSGIVVIHADNGAVAAKLRQMSRRLSSELSQGGLECNDIEVKVQPRQNPGQSRTSTLKPLSGKAFGMLRSTSENLPPGPLRAALEHLLAHAARRE